MSTFSQYKKWLLQKQNSVVLKNYNPAIKQVEISIVTVELHRLRKFGADNLLRFEKTSWETFGTNSLKLAVTNVG